jgi:hypothetical protein
VSGCGAALGLLVGLVLLILGLGGAKGWIAVVGIMVALAIVTWGIVQRLRR